MENTVSQSIDDRVMTSIRWLADSEFAGIVVKEPSGWIDYEDFYKKKLTKDEFIIRLAKSEFTKHETKS